MFVKNQYKFLALFFIFVLSELICSSITSLSGWHYLTKPLIVTSLVVYFYMNSRHLSKQTVVLMLFALLFSLAGDVLLMFVNLSANYFIAGLIAFLLAHILYIIVFVKYRDKNKKISILPIIFVIYGVCAFLILRNSLNEMLVPVVVYMIVIMIMAIMASLRKGTMAANTYRWVLIGAVLFLVSDSLLAFNKFYQAIPYSNISIMLTYALAQLGIVIGVLKQEP